MQNGTRDGNEASIEMKVKEVQRLQALPIIALIIWALSNGRLKEMKNRFERETGPTDITIDNKGYSLTNTLI